MEKIGIDVHKTASQVCILTETGEVLERRIQTSRESLSRHLGNREAARILIEASTESEWVARCLEQLGHEVVVADPNFAPMYATRSRRVKTDRRDARALCDACHLGAYRPAHRSTDGSRDRRARLAVREVLVGMRTKMISLVRALVRGQGLRIPSGGAVTFARRLSKVELSKELAEQAAPLLSVLETVNEQLRAADASLEQAARDDVLVQRLCTARSVGVGPVTAVTFVATVDQVERFESAKALRCLVKWAERIAARRGKRIAAVALARKLAGILYAMWRDGTRFGEVTGNAAKAAA